MNLVDAFLLTGVSLTVLAVVTLLRWRFAQKRWAAHPGGARGYLHDVALGSAELLPLLAAALVLRLFVSGGPGQSGSPLFWGVLAAGYACLVLARRVPPFSAARKRLMDCRMAQIQHGAA